MVRWYHLIMTAYGFWLPNDPRGSWSQFVGSWKLYKFGPVTKTSEKRSLAHDAHNIAERLAAKTALKYSPVRFDSVHRRSVADGFAKAISESEYKVHACGIGHDHAHLVVARHSRTIEQIAGHLKSKATMALTQAGIHPLRAFADPVHAAPTPWAAGIWSVFVNDPQQLTAAINYVQRHPEKDGLPPQSWSCVTPP